MTGRMLHLKFNEDKNIYTLNVHTTPTNVKHMVHILCDDFIKQMNLQLLGL